MNSLRFTNRLGALAKVCTMACGICLLAWGAVARGESVSREKPPAYKGVLEKWVTPYTRSMRDDAPAKDSGEPVTSLLRETFQWVNADGRAVWVIHRIDQAHTRDGAEAIARDGYWFRRGEQKISLVLARSIQPDGSERNVGADAAFVQSPQSEGDSGVYSNNTQLVVLFPQTKAQTVTESIVVVEDMEPRVAGELATCFTLDYARATKRVRSAIEMDHQFMARLKVVSSGPDMPSPRREFVDGKRVRLTWELSDVPRTEREVNSAPSDAVGPAVWLTTMKDWNAIAKWYQTLLQGREDLSPELARTVDSWTAGLSKPDDIVAALYSKVARDVRYTGLEFGVQSWRPHSPNEVWANRYGDCKDKGNLLRAMLRHMGIPSHLALLNAEHAGQVEPRAPSPFQLNHAILVVPSASGTVFLDPTISFGRPGLLTPHDADRDILVLKGGTAEWAHTPPRDAGQLAYSFDLTLSADGALAGWLTLDATDAYGALYEDDFASDSRLEQRQRMHRIVEAFFTGAQLIDVDIPSVEKWAGTAKARAYFVVPGVEHEGAQRTIHFPEAHVLHPALDETSERRTAFWQWQGNHVVSLRLKLPAGWAGAGLPHAFEVHTPSVEISSTWRAEPGVLTANARCRTTKSVVPPDQFPVFFNALRSLDTWLDQTVTVGPSSTTAVPTNPSPAVALTDFPLMPSADGQLELADRLFALDQKPEQRREALLKVIQWFPKDKSAVFRAKLKLSEIELEKNHRNTGEMDKAKRLLASAKGEMDPELYAWGEYLFAGWLIDAGTRTEGIAIYSRLANDTRLSGYRRAWSSLCAADALRESAPAEAERLLRNTLALEPEARLDHYRILTEVLLRQNKTDEVVKLLSELANRGAAQATPVLLMLVKQCSPAREATERDRAVALSRALQKVLANRGEFAQVLQNLKDVQAEAAAGAVEQQLAADLLAFVGTHPPSWWASVPIKNYGSREELLQALEKIQSTGTAQQSIRHQIELLTHFPPDPKDFPERLWGLSAALESRPMDESLFQAVLALCDKLPSSSEYRIEARFTRAKHLERSGDRAGALALYEAIAGAPQMEPAFRLAAWRLEGQVQENTGHYSEALGSYRKLEAERERAPRSYNGLLRAAFLNLELNHRDEALRIIALLPASGNLPGDIESPDQVKDFVALARAGQAAAYWKRQERWWPAWSQLEAKLGLPPLNGDVLVPIVPNLFEAGKQFGVSLQQKDRPAVFALLRTMAHAARWQPRGAIELAGIATLSVTLTPELARELNEVVMAMLTNLDAPDVELVKSAQVQLAARAVDAGHPDQTSELALAYFAKYSDEDALGQGMARVFGFAAIQQRKQLQAAAAHLSAILKRPNVQDRTTAVSVLARILREQQRTADERALLTQELANPEIQNNAQAVATLKALLGEVVRDGERVAHFNAAVTHWRQNHQPSWFAFARPVVLDKTVDLDAALRQPAVSSTGAERAKLALLVLDDPAQPYERRLNALSAALNEMVRLSLRHSEVSELYRSLWQDDRFEPSLRADILWNNITDAAESDQDFGKLTQVELVRQFSEPRLGYLRRLQDFAAIDRQSPTALREYAERLLAGSFDAIGLDQLDRVMGRLEALGELGMAEGIYAKTESMALSSDAGYTKEAARFELLKSLNRARRLYSTREHWRQLILEGLPKTDSKIPAALADWRTPEAVDVLSAADSLQVRLHMLRTNTLDWERPWAWLGLAHDVEGDLKRKGLGLRVYSAMLADAVDDAERARIVPMGTIVADTDDPSDRAAMFAVLKAYRDPSRYPDSYSAIRCLDLGTALRNGDAGEFERALPEVKVQAGKGGKFALWSQLVRGVTEQNSASIKDALAGLPSDALLDPSKAPVLLPALELVSMRDEYELVRANGRTALYRTVLASWSAPKRFDIHSVLDLAASLGTPDAIPEGWFTQMQSTLQNAEMKHEVALFQARQRKDWSRALAEAEEVVRAKPSVYANYLYKGEALMRLGRKKDSVAPLEIYVKYCRDSVELRRGQQLLLDARAPH